CTARLSHAFRPLRQARVLAAELEPTSDLADLRANSLSSAPQGLAIITYSF
ncbi:hypothetical protein PoB_003785600, partial [Plakobranchus ocellatus]